MKIFIKSFAPILALMLIVASMMMSAAADNNAVNEATEVDIVHDASFEPTATALEQFKIVANGTYKICAINGEVKKVGEDTYQLIKNGDPTKRAIAEISWANRKAQVRERPVL